VRFESGQQSPGNSNFKLITNVVVNEVLTHTDPPFEDAIELYNPSSDPLDLSHWWISNSLDDRKKFQVPPNSVINPGGYMVFYEQRDVANLPHLGFNTSASGRSPDFTLNSAHGDSVYLFAADPSGNLNGYRQFASFGAQHGTSFGRFITTVGVDFTAMSETTFGVDAPQSRPQFRMGTGQINPYPEVGPLIINEIMYHAPDVYINGFWYEATWDQYVELYNMTTNIINLYDTNGLYFDPNSGFYADGRTNTWAIGINGNLLYKFPPNTSLAPGESLLLASFDPTKDPFLLSIFRSNYGIHPQIKVFGPFGGPDEDLLPDTGSLSLYRPDNPQGPSHPDFGFVPYILVDWISYSNSGPWPVQAGGAGLALHRIIPERYGNEPTNWAAALPTPGWQASRVESVQRLGNSVLLKFTTSAGSSYSVQSAADLDPGTIWTNLTNYNSQLTTQTRQFTAFSTSTSRFYRLATVSQ
jgi:hypothetical protein